VEFARSAISQTASEGAKVCLQRSEAVHVHANQPNPNIQLNSLYAAEKAEAKRETERTRKKLMEFASVLAGEACIVKLGAHDESQEQAKQDQRQRSRKEEEDAEARDAPISDWA
jgi:hypothetical protein